VFGACPPFRASANGAEVGAGRAGNVGKVAHYPTMGKSAIRSRRLLQTTFRRSSYL